MERGGGDPNFENEPLSEFVPGQRVWFVEGESMMGRGSPVTKNGVVESVKNDTIGVRVDGTSMVVQVDKRNLHSASGTETSRQ